MADLHEAFTALADRHPATTEAATMVARRARVRRRRRVVLTASAVVAVLLVVTGTAFAWRPGTSARIDVAGTVPSPATSALPTSTGPPLGTTTTFAPDDLRSVLPSPSHPVHVRVSGTAIIESDGPVQLCTGAMNLTRPPGCQGAVLNGLTVDDLRSTGASDEARVRGTVVVWSPASVQGWFDGATITPDGPLEGWHEGPLPASTFTAGGPGIAAASEQQMAVMNDLLAAGLGAWGGLSGGGPGIGLVIDVPWADQALVDLVVVRHPGVVVTLRSAMVPI